MLVTQFLGQKPAYFPDLAIKLLIISLYIARFYLTAFTPDRLLD
jgi:hypothetical protein